MDPGEDNPGQKAQSVGQTAPAVLCARVPGVEIRPRMGVLWLPRQGRGLPSPVTTERKLSEDTPAIQNSPGDGAELV